MDPLRVIVYSDFLCPWCLNAATRLESVEQTLGPEVALEWRSYLLRPQARPGRDLERFRAYTKSWQRVAEDEPRAVLREWASDEGPPTHSVPAHLAAKAAAALGPDAERRMRQRLFGAYFAESRDISSPTTLLALWRELGLPEEAFDRCDDADIKRRVAQEHQEALDLGASGVPAARLADQDFVLMGAQPEETYLRWLRRALDARNAAGA
ncbi:MAG: DsbA family protein [Myxococcota bacterium]|nr:DsbA family protein [Myxococcota bacterium]